MQNENVTAVGLDHTSMASMGICPAETYKHNDLYDLSMFENCKVRKEPIYIHKRRDDGSVSATEVPQHFALVNEMGQPLPCRPVSKGYKLVSHLDLYRQQALMLHSHSDIPLNNVSVTDKLFDGGTRAVRTIHFDDVRLDMPLKHGGTDGQVARMDIINSVDMSWAFQAFAGAYRAYCRNTQVFGGKAVYHSKQRHTKHLNVNAIMKNAVVNVTTYHRNRAYYDNLRNAAINEERFVDVMEKTLCRRADVGAVVTSDDTKKVNVKLLGQMVTRFRNETNSCGHNMWAAYNALTHYSTHVGEDVEYEREDKDGNMVATTAHARRHSPARVPHVQMKRQREVQAVLNSNIWFDTLRAAA